MFYLPKENFKLFFQLLYAISSFRLFINANSCCSRNVNAIDGVDHGSQDMKFEPVRIRRPLS